MKHVNKAGRPEARVAAAVVGASAVREDLVDRAAMVPGEVAAAVAMVLRKDVRDNSAAKTFSSTQS